MSLSDISVGQPSWTDEQGDKPKHGNIVYFYDFQKQDGRASKEAGRPIFKNVPYIHISTPGDNLVVIERQVRETDKEEYAREWAAYERKQANVIAGTPLEQWPQMNRLQVAELKALNIHSVEQLANLNEGHAQKVMGFHKLKEQAKSFLESSLKLANMEKTEEEAKKLQAQLVEKDKRIAELTVRMEVLERLVSTDQPRRKPGRPRKDRGVDPTAASSAG